MESLFEPEIEKVMYVAGETRAPSAETIACIENIVHDQVVELLRTANELANRRGSRFFSNADLTFQLRHDAIKLERLRLVLSWKGIRRTVNDADEKDTLGDEASLEAEADDLPDEVPVKNTALPPGLTVESLFTNYEVNQGPDSSDKPVRSEAAHEELRRNDERTRDMTAAEYATWTDHRHASFTWRKKKRFCEWSGLGVIAQAKANEEVFDILGFLAVEMVKSMTTAALQIQKRELLRQRDACERNPEMDEKDTGVFSLLTEMKKPIEARHVQAAALMMQPKQRKYRGHGRRRRGLYLV